MNFVFGPASNRFVPVTVPRLFLPLVVACTAMAAGCIAPSGTPEDPPRCGGIAASRCPTGLICVDDPRDTCDPQHGGADCGGLCVAGACSVADGARYVATEPSTCARIRFACKADEQSFSNDCGCGCEPACPVEACGPALGMPNRICPDGTTVAGPTGRCLPSSSGQCGWEVISCPDGP
jgi:hypothetical protein